MHTLIMSQQKLSISTIITGCMELTHESKSPNNSFNIESF